jgi:F-type H+-transporting ATPase subunit b
LELSWSTFVLEIINFLVLVWILKHFLYKPVLDMIARRRAGIDKTLADAQALHEDAAKLQEQYEGRLADWDQERQQAREVLARELEAERANKMAALRTTLEQEREKARVAEARRQADAMSKMEETALMQGARFVTRLLEENAGPETQARLVEYLLTELTQLPAARIEALRNSYGMTSAEVIVASAFVLSDDQQQHIKQALTTIAGPHIPIRFEQDSELLAGVRITIGAWVLAANLRDELSGFVALTHGD